MSSRPARLLLHLLLLLTAICIFVPFLPSLAQDGLDESWMFGMNTALAQGLIPGRDIVFTLGPYAAIYTRSYHPATDAGMVWGSLYLALSFAFVLYQLCRHSRWPVLLTALIVLAGMAYSRDALLLFLPLLSGAYTYRLSLEQERAHPQSAASLTALALAYAPFGLLVLVKGSMLVACLLTQLLSIALFLALRRPRAALVVVLAPALSLWLWWMLAGLPGSALADYFATSLPIISGYGDAMSRSGPALEAILYPVISGALLACLFVTEKKHGRAATYPTVYLILIFAAAAFLAFKGGFIRHDNHVGHALLAACQLLLAALLVCILNPSRPALLLLCASVLVWLGSSVHHAIPRSNLALVPPTFVMADRLLLQEQLDSHNWPAAARLGLTAGARQIVHATFATYADAARGLALRLEGQPSLAERHRARIAAIAAHAGFPLLEGSTDIYSFRQTRLIASGNQWNPRPVFQSYTVYTPALAELNRRHLVADTAPDNILLRLEAIDGRLPALEDGPSWPALLTHYAPAGFDNGYLLLKKRTQTSTPPKATAQIERHRLGERIALPDLKLADTRTSAALFARIHVRPSLVGQLIGTLYKRTPLHITLELRNGSTRDYRFIAGMAEAGFLLSPFVGSAADFALLYDAPAALDGQRVKAITIAPSGGASLWQDQLDIELLPLPATAAPIEPLSGLSTPQLLPAHTQIHNAEHCDGNLDQLNGSRTHDAQIIDGLLHASGWLARSATRGEAAQNIQLILTDPAGQHLRLATWPDPRPDIATYFDQPTLSAGGYIVAADPRSLHGDYTLRLAHEDGGQLELCPAPAIAVRFESAAPAP